MNAGAARRSGIGCTSGANAVIIGPISIGDDAVIGAGAVVTKSIPPRSVAVGNPARVISEEGSFDLIRFPDMDEDAQRQASRTAGEFTLGRHRNGPDSASRALTEIHS